MPLELLLSIGSVLLLLTFNIIVYWLLVSGRIDIIRRSFAKLVCHWHKDHRVESYIKGLRKLAE